MKRFITFVKWVVVMAAFLLVLWLPLVASVFHLEWKTAKENADPLWITRSEGLRLMRYHGTNGLKITDDRIYIWQDSRWIQVVKRKSA